MSKFSCGTISQIRPFFSDVMKQCKPKEHLGIFDLENIPSHQVEDIFFIEFGDVEGIAQNQCNEIEVEVIVNCLKCVGIEECNAKEEALIEGEGIISLFANPENKTNNGCINNIIFNRMECKPYDEENKNIIVISVEFLATVFLDLTK